MKYELGKYDVFADAHGKSIIEDMKAYTDGLDVSKGECHSVVVCVYADGFLQFAGGNAGWIPKGTDFPRAVIRSQAQTILSRFNPDGTICKEGGMA